VTVEMDEPKTEEENTAENTTWGQFASIYTPRGILQKLIVHVRERSVSSPSSCLLSSLVCLISLKPGYERYSRNPANNALLLPFFAPSAMPTPPKR